MNLMNLAGGAVLTVSCIVGAVALVPTGPAALDCTLSAYEGMGKALDRASYTNMAAGHAAEDMVQDWQDRCGGTAEAARANIEALTGNSPELVGAQ